MFLALALWVTAPSPGELARAGEAGLRAIQGPALSAHIRFLADDLLEGRAPGTRGHAIAARYFAAQLGSLGVAPAGEGGTWYQTVALQALRIEPSRCLLTIGPPGRAWMPAYGKDVLFHASPDRPEAEVSGPLVFAGHGIVAPIYGYDDTPADLRGKIAVILARAPRSDRPDFFPSTASAALGDTRRKARLLAERGAVGILLVLTPESLTSYPFAARVFDQAAFEEMTWMDGDRPGAGSPIPVADLTPDAFDRLLGRAGRRETTAGLLALSRSGKLRPFDLGLAATLRTGAATRRLSSENVVGVLPGSDPVLSREYVVFSAHLDHLGVGPAVAGDTIYNGALDDANGVASLIEIARAFASLPQRPARSILFLGATAEEKGLQGSDAFAHHSTVPLSKIVADINSDGPFSYWRPRDVTALGMEESSLERNARAAAEALGISLSPDPDPAQVYFVRGDGYSFARQGVPSVQPGVGYRDANGDEKANRALSDAWLEKRYHQPSDEWEPELDYENMAIEVRYYFLIGLSVARDPERPTWSPGGVLGRLFAGAAGAAHR